MKPGSLRHEAGAKTGSAPETSGDVAFIIWFTLKKTMQRRKLLWH